MSRLFAGLGGGAGAASAVAVVALLVAGAAWYGFSGRLTEAPAPQPVSAPQSEEASGGTQSAAPEAETTETKDQPQETEQAQESPVPPAFDEVRREADGTTIIAGRAAPGAEVEVQQDGTGIATATADSFGKFAAIAFVPPDGKGHVLTLLQRLDGVDLASREEIILAPLSPAPETAQQTAAADEASQEAPVTGTDAPIETAALQEKPAQPTAAETTQAPQTNAAAEEVDQAEERSVAETESVEATDQSEDLGATGQQLAAVTPQAEAETQPTDGTSIPESGASAQSEPAASPSVEGEQSGAAPQATAEVDSAPTQEPVETTAVTATTENASASQGSEEQTSVQTADQTPASAETASPAAAGVGETATSTEVAILKSTEEGVEVLNRAAPEVMDNVAIDTISYSDAGEVQLAGRAQLEAERVQIYLDNNAVVSLTVDERGRWRGDLPDVDEGIYTLRVDEVSADGTVTSRVETPFKREPTEVLAAAAADQDGPIKAITVQKGATLWAIARDRYGEGNLYVRVFEANRSAIRDPDLIYPGQIFELPD